MLVFLRKLPHHKMLVLNSGFLSEQNIVKSFRVSELQTLLEFAGRLKAGRKQELLDRALSLIDKGCPTSIVVKINDLNRLVHFFVV